MLPVNRGAASGRLWPAALSNDVVEAHHFKLAPFDEKSWKVGGVLRNLGPHYVSLRETVWSGAAP